LGDLMGPSLAASIIDGGVTLGPNGVAFVTVTGPVGVA
jgi:hypothetical protein